MLVARIFLSRRLFFHVHAYERSERRIERPDAIITRASFHCRVILLIIIMLNFLRLQNIVCRHHGHTRSPLFMPPYMRPPPTVH